MPKEKRYNLIGDFRVLVRSSCNVCAKDVSEDPSKGHLGYCPVCQSETLHAIPFQGCPWYCTEPHENDATSCCVCGAQMPLTEGDSRLVTHARKVKRLCEDCDPLGRHRSEHD